MTVTRACLVTREAVKDAVDYASGVRVDARTDRAIESATETVERLCQRTFHPTLDTRFFDWPNGQYARTWRLWLDENELISMSAITIGGVAATVGDFNLEPANEGPPFDSIEADLSTTAAFSSGSTHQRAIAATGLYGYHDIEQAVEDITAAVSSTTATTVDVHDSVDIGVGDLLRIDTERLIVTDRTFADTGGGIGDDLTALASNVSFLVDVGSHFHPGETIRIDSERMFVTDVAGDTLTVVRAVDGTVLAAHLTGASVWRRTRLTVIRGAHGSTAATHLVDADVFRWVPPAGPQDLALAEAVNQLEQEGSAYARVVGSGEAAREARGAGLADKRRSVRASHGRMARKMAV